MEKYIIPRDMFYTVIIQPLFSDTIADGVDYRGFRGTLGEFTLMDEVSSSETLINVKRVQNILQRRDASCELNYKKLFGTRGQKITVDEVYAATKLCRNELYQGCLRDWRNNKQAFEDRILEFFQRAITIDTATNAYFGDITRVVSATAEYSTDKFDGIFTWLKKYIAAGIIPAAQTIAIADGTDYSANPTAAYTLIKAMYDKQNITMRSALTMDKAFFVSQEIYDGYSDYITNAQIAGSGTTARLENGTTTLAYKGIPLLIEPIFTPVITQIKGAPGYAAILTYRGNFVFATDKNYGEGPIGDEALTIHYSEDDMVWYWRAFFKAGTQIGMAEHIVVALTSFA